jgi:hypothetical protein
MKNNFILITRFILIIISVNFFLFASAYKSNASVGTNTRITPVKAMINALNIVMDNTIAPTFGQLCGDGFFAIMDECPPWNKKNIGCFDRLNIENMEFNIINEWCGEAIPNNTYFAPKIKVRHTLGYMYVVYFEENLGHGECTLFPTVKFGWPRRYCARKTATTDPGYRDATKGRYPVDTNGNKYDPFDVDDYPFEEKIKLPQLCLYVDTFLGQAAETIITERQTDILDYNPHEQITHVEEEMPIFIKALVGGMGGGMGLFTKSITNVTKALAEQYKSFATGQFAQSELSLLMFIMKSIAMVGIPIVREFFRVVGPYFNSTGEKDSFDCVELPFGPYPPNYCPSLEQPAPIPKVKKLCWDKRENNEESDDESTEHNEVPGTVPRLGSYCDIAPNGNNYINNGIRVGFNYPTKRCESGQTPENDDCALFKNHSALSSYLISNNHLIKNCNNAGEGETCVEADCSGISCPSKFRVIYKLVHKETGETDELLKSWVSLSSKIAEHKEVEPWGIDKGQFADLYYRYEDGGDSNIYYWKPSEGMVGPNEHGVELEHYDSDSNSTSKMGFVPKISKRQICVESTKGENTFEVGCHSRPVALVPSVENCSEHSDFCDTSTNTHARPKAVMKFNVKPKRSDLPERTVRGIMKPHYAADGVNERKDPNEIAMLGNSYSVYAVDKEWNYIPRPDLAGTKDDNIYHQGTSRFGKYLNEDEEIITRVFYDTENQSGNEYDAGTPQDATNLQYFKGLEYTKNHYKRGGNKLCIEPQSSTEFKIQPPTSSDQVENEGKPNSFDEQTEEEKPEGDSKIDFQKADEEGFCANIPQPICPEITQDETGNYYGNAMFPSASFQETVDGSCHPDYLVREKPPKTTCGVDENGNARWIELAENRKCQEVFHQVVDEDAKHCYKINKIKNEAGEKYHRGISSSDPRGQYHEIYLPDEERPNESEDKTYSYYIRFTLNDSKVEGSWDRDPFKIYKVKPRGKTTIKLFVKDSYQDNSSVRSDFYDTVKEFNTADDDNWVEANIENSEIDVKTFYIGVVTTGKTGPADIKIKGDVQHEFTVGCGKSE